MIDGGLTRKEQEVMGAVFTLSGGRERLLVSPKELLAMLTNKKITEEKLEKILLGLELDGYFQLTPSDRKGEKTYVIHLSAAGMDFDRSNRRRKRSIVFRLFLAGVCAVLSFCVGLLLKLFFA